MDLLDRRWTIAAPKWVAPPFPFLQAECSADLTSVVLLCLIKKEGKGSFYIVPMSM